MFISVDLPAPFSPSSACTSPSRRSKSTWSFASTPGNRFVMPRNSRTDVSVGAAATSGDSREKEEGGPSARPLRATELAELRRRLDLAGDDLRAELRELLQVRGGHGRIDLAHADAVVLEVERDVLATREGAVLRALDREVDA